jgi:hypothetical protein
VGGIFERRLQPVFDLTARGGGGILQHHAEAEDDARRDNGLFGRERCTVIRDITGEFRKGVWVEVTNQIVSSAAGQRQQLANASDVVAGSVDLDRRRQRDQ